MTEHLLYYSSLYVLSRCKLKAESIQPSKLIMKSSPQGTPTQETEVGIILLECMWEQMKNDANCTTVHDSEIFWHLWITLLWSGVDIDLLSCNVYVHHFISTEFKPFEMRSCPFCRAWNTTTLGGLVLLQLVQGLETELVTMVLGLSASGYCSVSGSIRKVLQGWELFFFLKLMSAVFV